MYLNKESKKLKEKVVYKYTLPLKRQLPTMELVFS